MNREEAIANQNNGRLINADALMDLLKARKQFFIDAYGGSFHCMSEKDKARCDEIDACIASIVNAPTVSADAEQGEWIVREYCTNELDYCRWIEIECPFCGERPTYENLDNMNFCPNCGAKMCKGGDLE